MYGKAGTRGGGGGRGPVAGGRGRGAGCRVRAGPGARGGKRLAHQLPYRGAELGALQPARLVRVEHLQQRSGHRADSSSAAEAVGRPAGRPAQRGQGGPARLRLGRLSHGRPTVARISAELGISPGLAREEDSQRYLRLYLRGARPDDSAADGLDSSKPADPPQDSRKTAARKPQQSRKTAAKSRRSGQYAI